MPDPSYAIFVRMATQKTKPTAMRVTSIRLGTDLQRLLEAEATRVGVSVSQYVREAALTRASAAASARGEDPFELLAHATSSAEASKTRPARQPAQKRSGGNLRKAAREARSDAQALKAQSKQAQRRSRQLASTTSETTTSERAAK
jgi:hypothetical protein